jgi:hypothetical protein
METCRGKELTVHQGISLPSLIDQVVEDTKSAKDYTAPERTLSITATDAGILMRVAEESMAMRNRAHQQLAGRIDVPIKYWERMREKAPGLLAVNANHWLAQSDERRLVRTVRGEVRAILSERYRTLDNLDLVEHIIPVLQEKQCRVESCQLTEDRLYLQASFPSLEREVKVGDVVRAGVIISNSEVGSGSVSVKPMIMRLVCSNGMIADRGGIRRAHLGRRLGGSGGEDEMPEEWIRDETRKAEDAAWWMKVVDSVRGSLDEAGFDANVAALTETTERKITKDPGKVIEVTAKKIGLTEDERGKALLALCTGGDMTHWALCNSVTGLANDNDISYTRAVELEKAGGLIAGWTQEEWDSIFNAN